MIDKEQQEIIRDFLAEYGMTQTELAYESGIGVRTLYNALHSGKISEETWSKILRAMLTEYMQRDMILNSEKPKKPLITPVMISLISIGLALLITLALY